MTTPGAALWPVTQAARVPGGKIQGRFKSPAVQCAGYLLSCGRYIERNPLEAGLVAAPWEYAWSSSRVYASGEPDPLVAANPYYEELSKAPERRWCPRSRAAGEEPGSGVFVDDGFRGARRSGVG